MKIRKLRMAAAAALISQGVMVQAQTTLEEVVVTAQKRAQSIQEVPISITAFSGEYLEDKGIQKIAGVAQLTPNFNIAGSTQPAGARIQIRGIGIKIRSRQRIITKIQLQFLDAILTVLGALAIPMACTDLLVDLGLKIDNILMLDSRGVIHQQRVGLDSKKQRYARDAQS